MSYLIDGDNLLGRWPGRARSDGERMRLIHELARFARRVRRRTVVCFDGSPPPGTQPGRDTHWAGHGHSADDWIVARLEEERDRRGWTLVTDDRPLADRCRWLGAGTESCRRFRERLTTVPGGEKPEREPDVDDWLERFGGGDG